MHQRLLQPELMDNPRLPKAEHLAALDALRRVHWVSRIAPVFWPHIRNLAHMHPAHNTTAPLRVLDLATGGGDLPIALAARAREEKLPIQVFACDLSRRALALARLRARRAGVAVRFFKHDLLGENPPGTFDVVTCSLFLHHLTADQAVRVLAVARRTAARAVLIDDLRRCRMGLLAAAIGTQLLTRSRVVHVDALRSVRAAFTTDEMSVLARRAGLQGHTIQRHWPWRQLLVWHNATASRIS